MQRIADITFHPSWWYKNAGIEFDEKFFFDTSYHIKADREMRRVLYDNFSEYGLGEKDPKERPILFSDLLACGFLHSYILGCDVLFEKNNAPTVICANINEDAVKSLKVPQLDEDKIWKRVKKQIDDLYLKFGYVESAVNLMGIQNIAMDLRGEELFYDYYDEPELAEKLLDTATKLSVDIGKRLYSVSKTVSGGVTSVIKKTVPSVYLTSNCSVTMISKAHYGEFLLKYDTALANEFTDFGIHHCGNNTENVIEEYLKVPNLKFLEIGAGSNLQKVADAINNSNKDIISCVRYSPVQLKTGSKEQIKENYDSAVKAFGTDKNLCFSCVGIDADTSTDRIKDYLAFFKGEN